jgi:hypothetical protein
MKKSALLVALSAASLAGGIAFAQTQPQTTQPQGTQPEATKPSANLTAIFDKADTNKDGKLDAAELGAAASMSKRQ